MYLFNIIFFHLNFIFLNISYISFLIRLVILSFKMKYPKKKSMQSIHPKRIHRRMVNQIIDIRAYSSPSNIFVLSEFKKF